MNLTTKQIMSILKDAPTSELRILSTKINNELHMRAEAERSIANLINTLSHAEKQLICNGRVIDAMKSIRDRTGLDIKSVRDIAVAYRETHKERASS